jgi:NitT/TauT family transport system ATP-binding protein
MSGLRIHNRSNQMRNLTLLHFTDVCFGYSEDGISSVIQNISFEMKEQEFICLLGRSGCGKSTLMSIAAGLIKPWSGNVLFNGHPLKSVNTEVGYMTQGDTLFPWRTVEENLRVPWELAARRGKTPDDMSERIRKYLSIMSLTGAEKLYPAQLSGGMKRRALLARSLIYEPKMLLMDEPFAALDAQMRAMLHQELINMVRGLNQSVMFITHDINEAVLLSDRVITLAGAPSNVVEITQIPFGRDRNIQEIAGRREFTELVDHLWGTLDIKQ